MATVIVDCSIPGESELSGTGVDGAAATHNDKLDAIGIHDLVVGSYGMSRGDASEIQLVRNRDRASPKLAEKCASGQSIGSVTIHIFKNDNGLKEVLKLALGATYVSRIEYGTVDGKGIAYRRHYGGEGDGAVVEATAAKAKGSSVNTEYREYSRARAQPYPIFNESPGAPTENEVERVWLNCANIAWTATGNVRGSYNNTTGKAFG